jgi:hypothetical protein
MKKMQEKSKEIQIYKTNHKLPSNQTVGMANTMLPPQRIKMRRIEGFGENIGQLPLCVNKFHLYLSLFNMISQKVVSHFDVFCSSVENWVMGKAYGTRAITHEGYTLVGHSIIYHGLHYPKYLGVAASSSYILGLCSELCNRRLLAS